MAIAKTISADYDGGIGIGRQGESGATEIVIDISTLTENYGSGTAALYHQRSGDTAAYAVASLAQDDDAQTATWAVDSTDTAVIGQGKAQLVWTVDSVIAKTIIWRTLVTESLTVAEAEEE